MTTVVDSRMASGQPISACVGPVRRVENARGHYYVDAHRRRAQDEAPRLSDREADLVTRVHLTKPHTIFSNAGIDNRATRLQACELLIGIEVVSSRDLTKEQASRLIDCLEQEAAEGDLTEFIAELIGRADDAAEDTP